MLHTLETDVLIIGGGGAAARAAVEAHDLGAGVTMITKGVFGKAGATAYSVSEIASFNVADGQVDPLDTPEVHFQDTVKAGRGMCDERLARILAEEAQESLDFLEGLGVRFERENGRYVEAQTCFHSRPRSHILKGHAKPILNVLKRELEARRIRVLDRTFMLDLVVGEDRCLGAIAVDREGDLLLIHARSTVLATGGGSNLFALNLNPRDITGDGYAAGYRAGAELTNMEFMQAGLGIVRPIHQLFSAWLWALGPTVRNGEGEEFVARHLPNGVTFEACLAAKSTHFPFTVSDDARWLDVAIVKEVRAGRCTARKGIFVDFTGIDEALLSRSPRAREARQLLPLTRQWLKARHVDMDREPLEVAWFSHAINGGLRINERGETSVLGLLAAGEVAAGPHGADRLGGNMLVACQVFGRRSGRRAALLAKELPPAGNVPVVQGTARMWEERLASRDGEIKPADLKRQLQRMMYDTVLVLRSEETLTRSLQGIQEMRERARRGLRIEHVRDLCERQELENLLQVGEIVARAALLRRESRGSHYREDFPELDPKWGESIVSRRNGSALEQFRGKLSSC